MLRDEEIQRRLAELNEAWHACANLAYNNHPVAEMEQAVRRLDTAQDWFKARHIKLDNHSGSGDHYSLAAEQPRWRHPDSHSSTSYTSYLNELESMRRR